MVIFNWRVLFIAVNVKMVTFNGMVLFKTYRSTEYALSLCWSMSCRCVGQCPVAVLVTIQPLCLYHKTRTTLATEPRHDKTNKMSVRPAKTDPPSLIKVFAVRMKKAWVLSYPLSAQWRHWSDWADTQADLSLRWVQSNFVSFVMSRFISRAQWSLLLVNAFHETEGKLVWMNGFILIDCWLLNTSFVLYIQRLPLHVLIGVW